MNLRWTDAGRAALASSDHTGAAAVKLTHFAIGDGQGPGGAADDSRAALRNERHRAAIEGTEPTNGRIAFRADFAPDASYGVTEAGVFGTAGDPAGPLTLLLYWSDDGAEAGKAAANTALTFAVVVEFQSAAADVAVTVGGNIVFGATEPATEAAFGSTRYATGEETGTGDSGERSVTPKGLKGGVLKLLGALVAGGAGDGTIYQLKGDASGALVIEERTQDGASKAGIAANVAAIVALADRVTAVEGKTDDAATNRKGIVELATDGEAKTGTDARRAVTPKAMRAATADNIASLLDSAPEEGKKYILEGLAAGGLKLVLSSVLMTTAVMTERWQSTVTYEYNDSEDESQGVYLQSTRRIVQAASAPESLELDAGVWVYCRASELGPGARSSGGSIGGTFAYWPRPRQSGHGVSRDLRSAEAGYINVAAGATFELRAIAIAAVGAWNPRPPTPGWETDAGNDDYGPGTWTLPVRERTIEVEMIAVKIFS